LGQFSTLVVCSGNLCRSPLGELLLRGRLGDVAGVRFASAGTVANPGDPMPEPAGRLALSLGADPSGHQARRLDARIIGASDLILAASREHRRAIATLVPSATRKTFTMREFARLAEGVTVWDFPPSPLTSAQRLTQLVEVVASRRGTIAPPESPDDDDIIDPYQQSDSVYTQSAAQLVPAVDGVVAAFRLALGQER
jgi:protein-tyrosine phosphatase